MNSHTSARFRKAYRELPLEVRQQAREAYKQFLQDPFYPSLRFKQIHSSKPIYSVRVTRGYRALGVRNETKSCGSGLEHMLIMIALFRSYDLLPHFTAQM